MSNFYASYPVEVGGSVPTYSTLSAFPSAVTAGNGALAIALDTDILYISNGTIWEVLANPSYAAAITSLTGDVTATGPGAAAATVAKIQGTVVSGTTGSGNVVFSTSPTLVTPALGTPSALVGTNITGTAASLTSGITDALASASTTVNVSSATAPTVGQILTAVDGTHATWQAPATSGTVTSVSVVSANGLAGTVATATSTPAITLSTTITGILQGNGTAISAATTTGSGAVVLATSPTLVTPALGTPSALVGTNITGTAASLTAGITQALASATTTVNVSSATAPSSGQVLTATSSTAATWQTPTTGTVTTVSVVSANGFAGTVANASSTPAITLSTSITGVLQGNGTAISAATTTGSGSVVLATSPTLVTPALGTPSSGNLSNCTSYPTATDSTAGITTSYSPIIQSGIKAVSAASYTGTETDGYKVITFATSTTSGTYTTPAASVSTGRRVKVIKTDTGSGSVTVAAGSGSLLGPGSGNPKVSSQGGVIELECDGTNWYITNLQDTGTFVGTIAGGTTAPTATVRYTLVGDVVSISMTGNPSFTKNTDSSGWVQMTGLPASISPSGTAWGIHAIEVNGGANACAVSVSSATFTWYRDLGQDGIANSATIVILGTYTFTFNLNN